MKTTNGGSENLTEVVRAALTSFPVFTSLGGISLRSYQREAAEAILGSITGRQGHTLVVMFPRQSGKNELQAQLEAYLLLLYQNFDVEIVKVSPTLRPQAQTAMRRLERALRRNPLTRSAWQKEGESIFRVGRARMVFLSAAPGANIVGATASLLLEVDEAQDVQIEKFDRDVLPMAAAGNATRVFFGTAWTSSTLLARELRAAKRATGEDGIPRAFVVDAQRVAAELPAYGTFVRAQTRRLGRNHPLVSTQFYAEEVDAQTGMFPADRRARMRGNHAARTSPAEGALYALLVDVGGADESLSRDPLRVGRSRHDATALTVVEVNLETLADEALRLPAYRTVDRREWVGADQPALFAELSGLAAHWRAIWVVVDATGVGAGLASFLERALPGRIVSICFSAKTKSDLGWGFLSAIQSGRYHEYATGDRRQMVLQEQFWSQTEFCQGEIVDGPGKLLRWGVPDGARHPANGTEIHDDLLVSAAMCQVLDRLPWAAGGNPLLISGRDPLRELDYGF